MQGSFRPSVTFILVALSSVEPRRVSETGALVFRATIALPQGRDFETCNPNAIFSSLMIATTTTISTRVRLPFVPEPTYAVETCVSLTPEVEVLSYLLSHPYAISESGSGTFPDISQLSVDERRSALVSSLGKIAVGRAATGITSNVTNYFISPEEACGNLQPEVDGALSVCVHMMNSVNSHFHPTSGELHPSFNNPGESFDCFGQCKCSARLVSDFVVLPTRVCGSSGAHVDIAAARAADATIPTFLLPTQRFQYALDALKHLAVQGTTLKEKRSYGNFAMHQTPPRSVHSKTTVFELVRGDVLFIPRGWWHWVVSENNTASVAIWDEVDRLEKIPPSRQGKCFVGESEFCSELGLHWEAEGLGGRVSMMVALSRKGNGEGCSGILLQRLSQCLSRSPENGIGKEINMWTSTGPTTTPLHFDDKDNFMWVLRGVKRVVVIPPSESQYLLPTVFSEPISEFSTDMGVVQDVGIRAWANEYWQDPELLLRPSPPGSVLLGVFLEYFNFPSETFAHLRILQYVFGPQTMVFSCKLTKDLVPYIEVYIYCLDSGRPEVYDSGGVSGDLNKAIDVVAAVSAKYFGIKRPLLESPVPPEAILFSFEIHRDTYEKRRAEPLDFYFPSRSSGVCGVGGQGVVVHEIGVGYKGTFCREDPPEGPGYSKYYWRGVKVNGLFSHYHVGLSIGNFLEKLLLRSFPVSFVNQIAAIPNVENTALEFCDNVDVEGAYARSAFYGIF